MKFHTSKDSAWLDESGAAIPFNRTTPAERGREKSAASIYKEAKRLNKALASFKNLVRTLCDKAYKDALSELKVDPVDRKGNFTWFNFDRSFKVEVSINDRIEFDDLLIQAAQEKLRSFLATNTSGIDDMISKLIMDAFQTTRGKLDTKRVMNLVRYRSRLDQAKYPEFHEAIDFIEKSIRKPESKTYYRVWERDANGEYQVIDLNISSI